MPDPDAGLTRRRLVLGTLAGAAAGGAWGAAIQSLAKPSKPTISLLGKKTSQIALIDTTRVRILVMLGPADDDLIEAIPMLLTVVRQRVDILIGASVAIDRLPAGFTSRWRVSHTFAIPAETSPVAATRIFTPVVGDLRLEMRDGMALDIRRSTRNDWTELALPRQLWTVSAAFAGATVVLAPDIQSLEALAGREASLISVPEGDIAHIARLCAPASIAMNARDGLEGVPGAPLVRVYPRDVARFTVDSGKLTLPNWVVAGD